MIQIRNTSVTNIARAVYSARNAMNSWSKSDSDINSNVLGEADLTLAIKLCKAGTDHRKFMRMIDVTCDITAPSYWIAEHDTYKVGTTRNSCSFMHKGVSKPFSVRDFSVSSNDIYSLVETNNFVNKEEEIVKECLCWQAIIARLNDLRDLYLSTQERRYFEDIRRLLPSGYNIRYTWHGNYEVLANIYRARHSHYLPEWIDFCNWIKELPYAKELIIGEKT